tara:strand:+ start:3829 stop:6126 length:2298 start_codon:yes stop_codon:yes gene_type:complete
MVDKIITDKGTISLSIVDENDLVSEIIRSNNLRRDDNHQLSIVKGKLQVEDREVGPDYTDIDQAIKLVGESDEAQLKDLLGKAEGIEAPPRISRQNIRNRVFQGLTNVGLDAEKSSFVADLFVGDMDTEMGLLDFMLVMSPVDIIEGIKRFRGGAKLEGGLQTAAGVLEAAPYVGKAVKTLKEPIKSAVSSVAGPAREFIANQGGGTRLGANDMTNIIAEGVVALDDTINPKNVSKTSSPPSENLMGINVRSDTKNNLSYADLIIDGQKTFETRDTNSLKSYIGKKVAIVKTGEGDAKAIGTVTVGEPIEVNAQQFRELQDQHLVPQGSTFDIKEGKTKFLYPLSNAERFDTEQNVGKGIVARKVLQSETAKPNIDEVKKVLNARAEQMKQKTTERVQPSGQNKLFDTSKEGYEKLETEQKDIEIPRNTISNVMPLRNRTAKVIEMSDQIADVLAKRVEPVKGTNVQFFYHTGPLINKAVELGIPKEKAVESLKKFAMNYAVTSPRTMTEQNLRNASLVSVKENMNKSLTDIIGPGGEGVNEKGYPMMINPGGIHRKLIDDKNAGTLDVNTNPKPISFAENVAGNLEPVTVDTHAIRAVFDAMNEIEPGSVPLDFIGGKKTQTETSTEVTKKFREMYKKDPSSLDVSTMINDTLASQMLEGKSMQTEYAVFVDIYKKVAEKAGVKPAEAQSLSWFANGNKTGLASEPKTVVDLIDDRVDVTAQILNKSKEEVFKKFFEGSLPLLSIPVGVTLLETGAMMENEDGE